MPETRREDAFIVEFDEDDIKTFLAEAAFELCRNRVGRPGWIVSSIEPPPGPVVVALRREVRDPKARGHLTY